MEKKRNSVLLVDDEAVNIRALIEILSEDYVVYVEKSGKKSIEAAKRLVPDLILLDVMMPEMDGFEVIEALKADNEVNNIPVIFITGLVSPDEEAKGFFLGAVDYIKKPFSEHVVKTRVNHQIKIINQQRRIQALREVELIENQRKEQERINKRIKYVIDSAPISIEVYDENANLIEINEGTLKMYGMSDKNEFIKLYNESPGYFSPTFQSNGLRSDSLLEDLFVETRKWKLLRYDWIHRSLEGEEFPTEVTLSYVKTEDTAMYISYVHDLREIVRLENERVEALEEASKAKSRFLAKMSHEIRTPITAVLGISEILLREQKVPDTLEEAFTKIYDSSKTLLKIVNDILDFSKIEEGKMPLINTEYEVITLIRAISAIKLAGLENEQVTFTMRVDEKLPKKLIGDVLRVNQVITNLLSNAFKYTEAGTVRVSLGCEITDDEHMKLIVKIEDTGRGMTPQQLEAVKGDEYIRHYESETPHVSGTGLGIPIVYMLAQMMGAKIEYNSELGRGTFVTASIPQKIVGTEVLGSELARKLENFEFDVLSKTNELEFVPEQMPHGKVLVVDDIDTNLYVARAMLESFGLTVDLCECGAKAVEKIKAGAVYDIIFMDQMMPEMDGIEATKKLREMGYSKPIVALTANAVKGQSDLFLSSGLTGFMTKPISIEVLSTYLIKFVKNKEE